MEINNTNTNMSSVTKKELVKKISKSTGIPQKTILLVIESLKTEIIENVLAGKKVSITGLVKFEQINKRNGFIINPKTNERLIFKGRTVKATPSKTFKQKVLQ